MFLNIQISYEWFFMSDEYFTAIVDVTVFSSISLSFQFL